MEVTPNYINGEWRESESPRTTPNVNPADPAEVLGTVRLSTREEIKKAVEAAEAALPSWRRTPAPQRGRVIDRAHQILQRRKDEAALILHREEGKLLPEAQGEIQKSINVLEFMSGEAMRLGGETLPSELPSTICYTLRQPIGVVAAITPWNFPACIPFWKIAPALATGCTIVLKPSTLTPLTAKLVTEVFIEAGVPAGVLNLVYASGEDAGEVLLNHPAVRAVSFTGSNDVGGRVYTQAAAQGKKVQCEMGGKNAVIVLEDADLELAVEGTVQGAFGSTGQRCTATSRAIVLDSVADRFVEALAAQGKGFPMGPIVDEKQFQSVLSAIARAKSEGAHLCVGGERSGKKGYFVQPTIFDYVRPEMDIAQEEIFGPVLAVLRVASFEEALRVANGVRYGLTSSIYSSDPGRIFRFLEEIETGITHVNSPTVGGEPHLPFGGMKSTGIGTREMGRTAIDFYTELKTVYLDYTGKKRQTNIY